MFCRNFYYIMIRSSLSYLHSQIYFNYFQRYIILMQTLCLSYTLSPRNIHHDHGNRWKISKQKNTLAPMDSRIWSFVIRNRGRIDGRLVLSVHQRINISEFFVHNYHVRIILGRIAVQSRQIDGLCQRRSVQRLFWQ